MVGRRVGNSAYTTEVAIALCMLNMTLQVNLYSVTHSMVSTFSD